MPRRESTTKCGSASSHRTRISQRFGDSGYATSKATGYSLIVLAAM